jgi:hypothetical protein
MLTDADVCYAGQILTQEVRAAAAQESAEREAPKEHADGC